MMIMVAEKLREMKTKDYVSSLQIEKNITTSLHNALQCFSPLVWSYKLIIMQCRKHDH